MKRSNLYTVTNNICRHRKKKRGRNVFVISFFVTKKKNNDNILSCYGTNTYFLGPIL